MSAIATAAKSIANLASLRMDFAPEESREDALTAAAESFVRNAQDAHTRSGSYRFETSTELLEDVLFHGSVARDILDGEVSRPSVGNVRAYALSLL